MPSAAGNKDPADLQKSQQLHRAEPFPAQYILHRHRHIVEAQEIMGGPRTSHGRCHALNGKARHATFDEQHAKFPGAPRRVFGKAKTAKRSASRALVIRCLHPVRR